MNTKQSFVFTAIVCLWAILIPLNSANAIPPLTPHVDTPATIQWEQDGIEDGNSAHNHRSGRSFGGNQMTVEPFSIDHCWDNRSYRGDEVGEFDGAHCFINESNPNNSVRYFFVGGATDNANNRIWTDTVTGVDAGLRGFHARKRITEIFDAYNAVLTDSASRVTGIEFVEVNSGNAEIMLYWEDQGGANNGGYWSDSTQELHFDNSMKWYFGVDPKLGDPFGIDGFSDDRWHFYSVALHEIGHAVGFEHQTDDSDVMSPPVGQPANTPGFRYFMSPDTDTLIGVRDVYSQPNVIPQGDPRLNSIASYFFWTNVFNATFYELHRSPTINGTYTLLHQEFVPTSGVGLNEFAATPPYFVKVRACNSVGCGGFSDPRLYQ